MKRQEADNLVHFDPSSCQNKIIPSFPSFVRPSGFRYTSYLQLKVEVRVSFFLQSTTRHLG